MNTYDLDRLVVLSALVSLKVVLEALSVVGDISALGGVEVVDHAVVEGEEGGCCTNLSTHVANRGHTRARERLETRTSVFDDGTSTTLDRQNASDLEDDI